MISKVYVKIAVLFLITSSCNESKETIMPETKNITESVYASGTVKSTGQYEVFSKQNGIIEKIYVQEGMPIKKGDTLLVINLENAKIATANARLISLNSDYKVNSDKLVEAENSLKLAAKKLSNDSLLFIRQKNLWAKNIGSKIDLEQRELSYENSKLNLISAGTRRNELKRQLTLASKQSKNNLESSKLMEEDFVIRSELDGVVYKLNKLEGELVNNQAPIAIIGSNDFIIELSIDENDIVKIKIGQKVIIRMDSYKLRVFEANLISIDPMMNERTLSFTAEAQFSEAPPQLFPNLTAEANIIIQEKKNVLTIPRKYLINDSTVMLQGGKLVPIKIGLLDYSLVEVVGGINAQTKIELPEK